MKNKTEAKTTLDRMIDVACGAIKPGADFREHRDTRRQPLHASAGLVQLMPDGGKSIPTVVQTVDFSPGGLRIISRYMLHVGYHGAILLERANREQVLFGVRIAHCDYAGHMRHESGLAFTGDLHGISIEDFRDEHGKLPVLQGRHAA